MEALIGYSGFVGGNLLRQRHFDRIYRSTDIDSIRGQSFKEVVCAGVPALKWWANQNPAADRAGIERLISHLDHVRAERFVLISTVDVYDDPNERTEDDPPVLEGLHPYGLHRAILEDYVSARFPGAAIVRLPALFGVGLKKNAIFDLLNNNRLESIPAGGQFQWYPLERLAYDMEILKAAGLTVVNFATPPVTMKEIVERFFPSKQIGGENGSTPRYNIRTRHDVVFGGSNGHMMGRDAVFAALDRFIATARS